MAIDVVVSIHPDEVLKAILAKGNRRDKEEKLRKLHELCSLEYSRNSQGARDLSIANMARIAESHSLFKARTIYNKQSEDYAALIRAWESYNGPKPSKAIKDQFVPTDKHAFLKKIEDPAIRSVCQMAIIERDKIRAELNMLKSVTVVPIDMRPLGAEIAKGATNVALIEPAAQLTDSERNALTAAIDPKSLAQLKLRIGDTGEIVDERGRFVFNPGFATAISKILGKSNDMPMPVVKSKRV
ncbi:MAG: gamma-mobile-trio protein GmtX [Betaproteobacteria bacterium]|nr:gamma-mobile-trio protein GmtX [Betaproteobacteria bacterium]